MFNIGGFARFAGVSTRTLRYYEELDLLRPAETDPATGYRRYRAQQLPRLHRVVALKELGLSLSQLRPLLDDVTAGDLRDMLSEARAGIEQRLDEDRERLARIERSLRYIESETDMTIDFIIKEIPDQRVAEIRWTEDEGLEFGSSEEWMRESIGQLVGHLASLDVVLQSPLFMYHEPRDDDTHTSVVAAGIGEQPLDDTELVRVNKVPAATVVSTVFRGAGDHDAIGPVYARMARFAEDNGYEVVGHGRDVIVGAEDDDVVLELQLPVAAD